jgi:hypothetical protein
MKKALEIFCATNEHDSVFKKWCFLLKTNGYQNVSKMGMIVMGFIIFLTFLNNYLHTSLFSLVHQHENEKTN